MDASRSARRTGWPAERCRDARASCCSPTSSLTAPVPARATSSRTCCGPSTRPPRPDSALSSLLSKLRRALGPGALTGRAELRLALPEPLWVDTEALATRSRSPRRGARRRRWADAAAQARAALAVATEPFLAECDGPWVAERRREIEGLRLRALEALAEAGLRLGGRELDAAEHAARTAIGLAPFRESAHRLLMEVHEAAGNPAEALRAFDELRALLRDELGTTPGRRRWPSSSGCCAASRARAARRRPPRRAVMAGRRCPAPLAAAIARRAFVGRADDLAALEALLARGPADDRRARAAGGRAGIGKSRLARRVRPRACTRTARVVLYGRFDEETLGAVPALRGDAARLVGGRAAGPRCASGSARARPSSAPCCRSSARRPREHSDAGSHGAGGRRSATGSSTRVAALLAEIAAERARCCSSSTTCTGPTARRCSCCATSCARPQPRRALFVGTYRDAELDAATRCTSCSATCGARARFERLELDGLARGRGRRADRRARRRRAAPEPSSRALHGETEGNPFFIEEVVRHLRDTAGALPRQATLEEAGVPEGVREVTARRLRRLPSPTRAVLAVGVGDRARVRLDLLEAVGPQDGDELVEALEEGVEARVLREVRARRPLRVHARAGARDALRRPLRSCAGRGCTARVGETLVRAARRRPRPAPGRARAPLRAGRAGRAARRARSTSRSPPRRRADRLLA